MKSGLSHEGKQSHGFQGYGFAACVGSGDHKQIEILSQMNINGNHLFGGKQRMASLTDADIMFRVKKGHGSVLIHGKGGFGKDKVQKSHNPLVFGDFRNMLPGLGA